MKPGQKITYTGLDGRSTGEAIVWTQADTPGCWWATTQNRQYIKVRVADGKRQKYIKQVE